MEGVWGVIEGSWNPVRDGSLRPCWGLRMDYHWIRRRTDNRIGTAQTSFLLDCQLWTAAVPYSLGVIASSENHMGSEAVLFRFWLIGDLELVASLLHLEYLIYKTGVTVVLGSVAVVRVIWLSTYFTPRGPLIHTSAQSLTLLTALPVLLWIGKTRVSPSWLGWVS